MHGLPAYYAFDRHEEAEQSCRSLGHVGALPSKMYLAPSFSCPHLQFSSRQRLS